MHDRGTADTHNITRTSKNMPGNSMTAQPWFAGLTSSTPGGECSQDVVYQVQQAINMNSTACNWWVT